MTENVETPLAIPLTAAAIVSQSFVRSSKTAGQLTQPFLIGSSCTDCGFLNFPPAGVCPKCLSIKLETKPLSAHGVLYSFTTVSRNKLAVYVGYVDLPEGIRVFSQLVGFTAGRPPQCGALVEILWLSSGTGADCNDLHFVFQNAQK
jgi:uncharacterized OB-fold protein